MSEKKVALVTGASSGIGQATAQILSQQGFTVYGTSRSEFPSAASGGVKLIPLDVRSDTSVARCVERVLDEVGRIDVLVNNAGHLIAGAIEEFTIERAQAQFDTNLWGTVRMTRAVLPGMRSQHGGHIINVTSIVGLVAMAYWGFY